ncbi:hypothetical protein OLZ31_06470 [Enterobacter asburiae]|nr:hypothetical protein [Enterobacter asburiae]
MIKHEFYEGGFWFRIFGYGLSVRNRDKFPSSFSVRNGYVKELRVGKYGIKILNREKRDA